MARISARAKRHSKIVDDRKVTHRIFKFMPVLNFILLSAIFCTMYHKEIAELILKAEQYIRQINF